MITPRTMEQLRAEIPPDAVILEENAGPAPAYVVWCVPMGWNGESGVYANVAGGVDGVRGMIFSRSMVEKMLAATAPRAGVVAK